MALISAAIAAISTAVATIGAVGAGTAAIGTAISAVATAAVSVSTVVGVAGMAVGAVGAITGNKDLMGAAKIMGYVGMGSALGGGLLGGASTFFEGGAATFMEGVKGAFTGATEQISKSWKEGVGSWFSPEAGAAVKPVQAGGVPGTTGVQPSNINAQGVNVTAPDTSIKGWMPDPKAGTPTGLSTDVVPGNMSKFAPGGVPSPIDPSLAVGGDKALKGVEAAANFGPGSTANQLATNPSLATVMGGGANEVAKAPGLLASMPEWAKYAALTSGAQGLTGLAAGYFNGLSAEEQLEFQKLVNQQNQNQQTYTNNNNKYAPTIAFAH